jgi:preprotein translocase subunit Sec63
MGRLSDKMLMSLCAYSHPDKIRSSDNQTKEEAEAYYVELTKAYKS